MDLQDQRLPQREASESSVSLLEVLALLLRSRRVILVLAFLGGVLGLGLGLASPKVYRSEAVFVPQGAETDGGLSGIAAAAAQLGVRVPRATGAWRPPMYVQLLHSRVLLEPLALDSVSVGERRSRVALMDLLEVEAPTPAERLERAVSELRMIVAPREVPDIGAVRVSVTTRWPEVSHQLAESLIEGLNRFNIETRSSQARSERLFAEEQTRAAQEALRAAEDLLQTFMQRNRVIASPELQFEKDRLQRDLMMRQQIATSLISSQEEARLREVRDTPVFTLIEEPRLPAVRQPRGSVQKAAFGAGLGVAVGIILAFFVHGWQRARRARTEESEVFLAVLEDLTPRPLRGRLRAGGPGAERTVAK